MSSCTDEGFNGTRADKDDRRSHDFAFLLIGQYIFEVQSTNVCLTSNEGVVLSSCRKMYNIQNFEPSKIVFVPDRKSKTKLQFCRRGSSDFSLSVTVTFERHTKDYWLWLHRALPKSSLHAKCPIKNSSEAALKLGRVVGVFGCEIVFLRVNNALWDGFVLLIRGAQ